MIFSNNLPIALIKLSFDEKYFDIFECISFYLHFTWMIIVLCF